MRIDDQRVAGVPCTRWRTRDDSGVPSVVCLTADGVTLRAQRDGRILIEAVRISYAAQDASLFEAPPGIVTRSR